MGAQTLSPYLETAKETQEKGFHHPATEHSVRPCTPPALLVYKPCLRWVCSESYGTGDVVCNRPSFRPNQLLTRCLVAAGQNMRHARLHLNVMYLWSFLTMQERVRNQCCAAQNHGSTPGCWRSLRAFNTLRREYFQRQSRRGCTERAPGCAKVSGNGGDRVSFLRAPDTRLCSLVAYETQLPLAWKRLTGRVPSSSSPKIHHAGDVDGVFEYSNSRSQEHVHCFSLSLSCCRCLQVLWRKSAVPPEKLCNS